jgi:hypothetical protein
VYVLDNLIYDEMLGLFHRPSIKETLKLVQNIYIYIYIYIHVHACIERKVLTFNVKLDLQGPENAIGLR